jgi:DDE superfamily endonuclease
MSQYCISYTMVMASVWQVVAAVNSLPEFFIEYPEDEATQQAIAALFCDASVVNFDNCAGAIDGILIWMTKPSDLDAEKAGLGTKKLYCGRKHKFGLNCQVVSDRRGRILDISLVTGGATADCLAFEASGLYKQLEKNLLHNGLVIFGDNAYLNTMYMATPYTNVAGGSKDNYNYYHSQLRIWVECCFGMLTQKWGILQTALPPNMSIRRCVALVTALAKLHNFCIDQKDGGINKLMVNNPLDLQVDRNASEDRVQGFVGFETVPERRSGGFTETTGVTLRVPRDLIGVGHHSKGVPRDRRSELPSLPRQQLHDAVLRSHKVRPTLRGTKVPVSKK